MIIIYDHTRRLQFIAHTAWICPRCHLPSAFECFEVYQRLRIYRIPVGSESMDYYECVCHLCLSATIIQAPASINISSTWRKDDGLQSLATETNPALGMLDAARDQMVLGDADLVAVIGGVYSSATNLPPDTLIWRIGVGLGMAGGLGLALLVALSERKHDLGGLIFASFVLMILGGFVGTLPSRYFHRASHRRDYYIARLQQVAARHRVAPQHLAAAARNLRTLDQAFVDAVDVLQRSPSPGVA